MSAEPSFKGVCIFGCDQPRTFVRAVKSFDEAVRAAVLHTMFSTMHRGRGGDLFIVVSPRRVFHAVTPGDYAWGRAIVELLQRGTLKPEEASRARSLGIR